MLATRIQGLAAEKGWTKEMLAEKCDLPLETIRNIWYGRTPDPKASTVMRIAEAFNIGVNCLMGKCQHTTEERTLLRHYRACGAHGKAYILQAAKYEALTAKIDREIPERHMIKCFIPAHEAFRGILLDECTKKEIPVSLPEAYAALQLTDNNFVPIFCKGDVLLFENRFPNHGEYGLFLIDKKIFLRKFLEEGEKKYRLQSLHDRKFDVTYTDLREIEYFGTFIDFDRT